MTATIAQLNTALLLESELRREIARNQSEEIDRLTAQRNDADKRANYWHGFALQRFELILQLQKDDKFIEACGFKGE